MFSSDVHYLVGKEKFKDMQRDAARQQLILAAKLGRPHNGELFWRMAGRIVFQLRAWGSKLQRHDQGRPQTLPQHRY